MSPAQFDEHMSHSQFDEYFKPTTFHEIIDHLNHAEFPLSWWNALNAAAWAATEPPIRMVAIEHRNQMLIDAIRALARCASPHLIDPRHPHGHIYNVNCDACHTQKIAQEALDKLRETR